MARELGHVGRHVADRGEADCNCNAGQVGEALLGGVGVDGEGGVTEFWIQSRLASCTDEFDSFGVVGVYGGGGDSGGQEERRRR